MAFTNFYFKIQSNIYLKHIIGAPPPTLASFYYEFALQLVTRCVIKSLKLRYNQIFYWRNKSLTFNSICNFYLIFYSSLWFSFFMLILTFHFWHSAACRIYKREWRRLPSQEQDINNPSPLMKVHKSHLLKMIYV